MTTKTLIAIAIVLAAGRADAWDGPGMWYAAADGTTPNRSLGGGGILGTGGQHDYGIKCSDCHVQRATETITLTLGYAPPLVNGTYVPGTRYTVTATMNGGNLPCMAGPNGVSSTKVRNFAASFEDDNGATAGALASDSGQTSASCPLGTSFNTTALDGDCKVIFGAGKDLSSWTFDWTAPASGTVHVFWGAVDGNCDMMSMGDAVTSDSRTLAAPPAARGVDEPPLVARIIAAFARAFAG
jgi:hypothetical protein